jgi:4-hydroxy-tetrahydrodipicolinate reductase
VVTDEPAAALAGAAVAIDFSQPEGTVALARAAAAAGTALVIGTTGFGPAHLAVLEQVARAVPVVRSGNMSLGVNLMVALVRRAAAALGPDYDIEIVEAHHRLKVDAPSGTALMLGRAAAAGRGRDEAAARLPPRDGITGPRPPGGIGYAVVRGGDIVGEHEVIFAGPGERLVLRHVAGDRMLFARGALAAAEWVVGRAPGSYDMSDVLGLSD